MRLHNSQSIHYFRPTRMRIMVNVQRSGVPRSEASDPTVSLTRLHALIYLFTNCLGLINIFNRHKMTYFPQIITGIKLYCVCIFCVSSSMAYSDMLQTRSLEVSV